MQNTCIFFQMGPIISDRPKCQHSQRSPGLPAASDLGADLLRRLASPLLLLLPLSYCPRQLWSPPQAPIPSHPFLHRSWRSQGHRQKAFWRSPSLNQYPYPCLLKLHLPERPSFSDHRDSPSPVTARVLKGFGVESVSGLRLRLYHIPTVGSWASGLTHLNSVFPTIKWG